jgi:hypothetical protein
MPGYFTTYDKSTGEIIHTQFVGSLEEAKLNEGPGHATVEGHHHHAHVKFVDGAPVAKTHRDRLPKATEHTVLHRIRSVLSMSDRYFTTDALDNITQAEQDSWRSYRITLRAAAKRDAVSEMLEVIPANPKGHDDFQHFRR